MLQPVHERQPSCRAQKYVPGVKMDPASGFVEHEGRFYLNGRLHRAIQPGEWVVLDSEDYATIWTDHDFRARFVVPEEQPSPHVGQVAGMLIRTPASPPEPPSALTTEQRQEVERIVEEVLVARFGPW